MTEEIVVVPDTDNTPAPLYDLDEEDFSRNSTDVIKWCADGSSTMEELAAAFDEMAAYIRSLAKKGWKLAQPVDNGWIVYDHDEHGNKI